VCLWPLYRICVVLTLRKAVNTNSAAGDEGNPGSSSNRICISGITNHVTNDVIADKLQHALLLKEGLFIPRSALLVTRKDSALAFLTLPTAEQALLCATKLNASDLNSWESPLTKGGKKGKDHRGGRMSEIYV
jgi:hypothetical protein